MLRKNKIINSFFQNESFRYLKNMIIELNSSLIYREIKFRLKSPDGYPFPPNRLIFFVQGTGYASIYYERGKKLISKYITHLQSNSINISKLKCILDFGCGCGRLIRHLTSITDADLYATDYSNDMIYWCKNNLTFGNFTTNNLTPPLSYNGNMFDFIYARSVFTHFDEILQKEWISELHRILKPSGILLLTTHGDQCITGLCLSEKKLYESGLLVVKKLGDIGSNPFCSYQNRKYIEDKLINGYELVSSIPGEEYLEQDVYILRKVIPVC